MQTFSGVNFLNLGPDVEALFQIAGRESFFNLPGWFALVAECGLRRGSFPGLIVDDRKRVALATCRTLGAHQRTLFSCTNAYTCEFELLRQASEVEGAGAFARELAQTDPTLEAIQLEGLDPSNSQFRGLVEGFRSAGWTTKPYFGWGTWFERTHGLGFGHYIAARPSILRNTWKRKSASLRKSLKCNFRVYATADDLNAYINDYESVRERSWKEPEPFPDFVPGVIRLAAGLGALRMGILDIEDKPAAAQFWLVWQRRATIFKLVYAANYAIFSPGTLLTMHMMETVLENDRPDEINFGRGDDTYKKMWLSSRRERWGIEAANPRTLRGMVRAAWLIGGLGRDYLKNVLQASKSPISQKSAGASP